MPVGYGRIARGWMMPFNGMVQKGMMEFGRGGPVCPPVSPCKGASIVKFPAHNAWCINLFWYGNAAARTFGRAHRHRPYHSNTCRHSAKVKTKILMLAVTLQTIKRKNIVPALHGDDKPEKILFPRCTMTIKS